MVCMCAWFGLKEKRLLDAGKKIQIVKADSVDVGVAYYVILFRIFWIELMFHLNKKKTEPDILDALSSEVIWQK